MATLFETQSWLRVRLYYCDEDGNTDINPSSISSGLIKYEKPDGTTGSWTGVHDTGTYSFYYDLTAALGVTSSTIKKWKFWLYLTATDSRVAPGEVAVEYIKEEGSVK